MTDPAAIFLLEAYWSSTPNRLDLADQLRTAFAGATGIRVLGLVEVPTDEAVLCLVVAETLAATTAIQEIAGRYGSSARLLEASWNPGGGS